MNFFTVDFGSLFGILTALTIFLVSLFVIVIQTKFARRDEKIKQLENIGHHYDKILSEMSRQVAEIRTEEMRKAAMKQVESLPAGKRLTVVNEFLQTFEISRQPKQSSGTDQIQIAKDLILELERGFPLDIRCTSENGEMVKQIRIESEVRAGQGAVQKVIFRENGVTKHIEVFNLIAALETNIKSMSSVGYVVKQSEAIQEAARRRQLESIKLGLLPPDFLESSYNHSGASEVVPPKETPAEATAVITPPKKKRRRRKKKSSERKTITEILNAEYGETKNDTNK